MSKRAKFPDLQAKFEDALRTLFRKLEPSARQSGPAILKWCKDNSADDVSDVEMADLDDNFSTYVRHAIGNGVIESHGKKKGYSCVSRTMSPVRRWKVKRSLPEVRPLWRRPSYLSVPPPRGPIKQWEGLFHFAATVALTLELGRDYHAYAHVCSLPKSTDHKEWGNPDMIAVRESSWTLATSALADDDLEKALRLADTSPECIITSVELKSFDHPVSRKEWFAAIWKRQPTPSGPTRRFCCSHFVRWSPSTCPTRSRVLRGTRGLGSTRFSSEKTAS